ncbi:MAG: heavy metal translocating P-type ATPase [Blautia sp.]|nr:heavy metal translocating P-type ATPase [Blautia sp.]
MRFIIKHEIRGRIRIHIMQKRMSYREADQLEYHFRNVPQVLSVKVQSRTQDLTVTYDCGRDEILAHLKSFRYELAEVPEDYLQNSGRALNEEYKEKLIAKVVLRVGSKLFLPVVIRDWIAVARSVKYIWNGIRTLTRGRLEVPVLDATAITASILRADYDTAGSIMFLLGIGEILEEWTHKKSVDDLARSMSLRVTKVWKLQDGQELLVPVTDVCQGDEIVVRMGTVIPFDGVVTDGEAMVNQSSMTGESLPVRKTNTSSVYAGTVLEEGELTICVKEIGGSSRFEKIVTMIEESEKLKSSVESKAEHLADSLVPYSLGTTALTWLLTQNVTKAMSVLMVDFSCALKLAMPISVLSAIREASTYQMTVKGGKYLEAVAEAKTIVFDKTGTLTKAQPRVVDVVPFIDVAADELLRVAACLEEHFPHSMAKAVVDAAREKNLSHEEMHSKVEYLVAHGISSKIDEHQVIIGSYHFVFEDEACTIPEGKEQLFDSLPQEYSHLYMGIDKKLAAVICVEDPLRPEASDALKALKAAGIEKIVMMTGDSERTACAIAEKVGVDEYFAEVLPEDKAKFVQAEKETGRKVIMIGDGINDSPALSAADVGIAISEGAEIAREIADITIGADDLSQLVTLKLLSDSLMKRIHRNYRNIVGFNAGLIILGIAGILQPTTSALLHNTSTLLISLQSMKDLI